MQASLMPMSLVLWDIYIYVYAFTYIHMCIFKYMCIYLFMCIYTFALENEDLIL